MVGLLTGKARQLEMYNRGLGEHNEHEQSNAMRCRGEYMKLEQPRSDIFYSYLFQFCFLELWALVYVPWMDHLA